MSTVSDKSRPVGDSPTKSTVGSVLDTCLAALQTLSVADRDSVLLALVAAHPPRGLRKLAASLGSNTTLVSAPAQEAKPAKKISSSAGKKVKQTPPAAKPWSKDPRFVALKAAQAQAAIAVKAEAKSVGSKLPADHALVVQLNDARTAVQNFRP